MECRMVCKWCRAFAYGRAKLCKRRTQKEWNISEDPNGEWI